MTVRQHIRYLYLRNNKISAISLEAIQGYDLRLLFLSYNELVQLPVELFFITKQKLVMSDNTNLDMNARSWKSGLCNEFNPELEFFGINPRSAAMFPELTKVVCQRENALLIDLTSVRKR